MTPAALTSLLRRTAAATVLCLTVAACASAPPAGGTAANDAVDEVNDPLEPVNRAIFDINDAADTLVIRPVAHTYVVLVPDPIRDAVRAFLRNLLSPLIIANELLQGDFDGAQVATGRMLTNTILGVGGLFDVAESAGMSYQAEDFGQTMAVWGLGDGPYLVLPLLGPSNVRDAVGLGVDSVADPVGWWGSASGNEDVLLARFGVGGIDRRSRVLDQLDDVRRNSLDYYATIRSLYRQQRAAEIKDNAGPVATPQFPDYDAPVPAAPSVPAP